jgi:hypothetical protein
MSEQTISKETEGLFSLAAGLEQKGRFRNTVFGIGKAIYILNMDKTLLIRFRLGQDEFEEPISFRASDYDSEQIRVEEGKVVFTQSGASYVREKSCHTPVTEPEDVEQLFRDHWRDWRKDGVCDLELNQGLLEVLDPNLSHIEILSKEWKLNLIQRNVHTGAVIIIRENAQGLLSSQDVPEFVPFGVRTWDLMTLFEFVGDLLVRVNPGGNFSLIKSPPTPKFGAILSQCLFDELGTIEGN